MPVPVISVAQMREWEKATWAAKRKPAQVISRVGHIVTWRVKQLTRPGDLIVILAGKGHNGDDARQTGQNLSDHEVTLLNVRHPAATLKEFQSVLSLRPALIVDGLFGIGLNRPLETPWIKLIEKVNRSQIPVLAIDVPSGLNADSGEPEGAAIRATVTLTLGAPKKGLLTSSAWSSAPWKAMRYGRCPAISTVFPRRDRWTATRGPSAISPLSPAAWVTTAPRCWPRAERCAPNRGWSPCSFRKTPTCLSPPSSAPRWFIPGNPVSNCPNPARRFCSVPASQRAICPSI